jgi:hypothetical protein
VPLTPLRLVARTIRPGKKVQLVQGSLFSGDVEVVRATLLRLGGNALELPTLPPVIRPEASMPPPGPARPLAGNWASGLGFWKAVETSDADGTWSKPGPGAAWFRLAVPIVAGEQPSPFQSVAAAADFGNGVSAPLERGRYSLINPDLTITLHRLPVGEWIGLDAVMYPEPSGLGMAESVLHDEQGRIGRAVQTILIEEL